MATLIDAAEFTSNEVYQIQATDPVEGAASGASFSGTGISNQPHQQLANRTAFLKQRQDVNISNIAVMQAFQALFTGLMAQNGYLKIPIADINKGLIQYIIQWGLVNWGTPQTQGLLRPPGQPRRLGTAAQPKASRFARRSAPIAQSTRMECVDCANGMPGCGWHLDMRHSLPGQRGPGHRRTSGVAVHHTRWSLEAVIARLVTDSVDAGASPGATRHHGQRVSDHRRRRQRRRRRPCRPRRRPRVRVRARRAAGRHPRVRRRPSPGHPARGERSGLRRVPVADAGRRRPAGHGRHLGRPGASGTDQRFSRPVVVRTAMERASRIRFLTETALAAVSGVLFLLTLVWKD